MLAIDLRGDPSMASSSSRILNRSEEDRIIDLIRHFQFSSRHLKKIHAHVIAIGGSDNSFVASKLVRSFVDLEYLHHARGIFDSMENPNVFVWTSLIRGYSYVTDHSFDFIEVFSLYIRMLRRLKTAALPPLTFTISSVLKACARAAAICEGSQIHAHAFKYGFRLDTSVQTTIIDFYGKCRRLEEARKLFDEMSVGAAKDLQAWNTLIAAYAEAGEMEKAEEVFERMPEKNEFTWVEMISGYARIGQIDRARRLFVSGLASNDRCLAICTTMITIYAKCRDVVSAREVFDGMVNRDVACWNAMITAYSNADLPDEAVILFYTMLKGDMEPNKATIAVVAAACAHLGSSSSARFIGDYVDSRRSNLLNNHTVASLIELYSKCGNLDNGRRIFDAWPHKDLICYSSMIMGLGIHGCGEEAVKVFNDLIRAGLNPDSICFVSVLAACSHAGMVDEGRRCFRSMTEIYSIVPTADHYMCMVDLLGRAGLIGDAYKLVSEEMPLRGIRPHAGVWGALLGACRESGNIEVGEAVTERLMEIEPGNAGNYILMSNIYAKERRWDGVAHVRKLMRNRGMIKQPGISWVEAEGDGGGDRRFMSGEVQDERVVEVLKLLAWEMTWSKIIHSRKMLFDIAR